MGGSAAERNGAGHRAYRRQQAALKRRTRDEHLPCAWCGEQIDTDLPPNHRMAFTADHPIPLTHGGSLIGQELVPLHRTCNAIKGAGVDTEIWAAT